MSTRLHTWRPGLFVALLALAAQLVLGVAAPDADIRPTPDQQLAALLADPGAICRGDVGGGQHSPHHHAIDCALCPYCTAMTTVAVLHSDVPTLPIPRAGPVAVVAAALQGSSVPPAPRLAARPRGPPILG